MYSYLLNAKQIEVLSSPHPEDSGFPWIYTPENFQQWAWEVFLEGFKTNKSLPTLEFAFKHVSELGYKLRVVE